MFAELVTMVDSYSGAAASLMVTYWDFLTKKAHQARSYYITKNNARISYPFVLRPSMLLSSSARIDVNIFVQLQFSSLFSPNAWHLNCAALGVECILCLFLSIRAGKWKEVL
ncbi:hypothetical protein ACMFMG_006685 [Clarireedia jacksonii]